MNQYIKKTILALLLITSLSGCSVFLLGSTVVGGLASYADRRTTGAQADDQLMEIQVSRQINETLNKVPTTNPQQKPTVSVVSYDRNILLLGMVANETQKQLAGTIARSQTAVKNVYNYIDVYNHNRTWGNIANDSWITSKVRVIMLKPRGFAPNHVKVVTYNGVTYVMGILTPAEQSAVTQQVRTTAGVQKVVTLYETFIPATQAPIQPTK